MVFIALAKTSILVTDYNYVYFNVIAELCMFMKSGAVALTNLNTKFSAILMNYTLNCNRIFFENLQANYILEYARFFRFLHSYLSCAVVLYTVIEGRYYSKKIRMRR